MENGGGSFSFDMLDMINTNYTSKSGKKNNKKNKEDKDDNINLRNIVKDINDDLLEDIDDFNNNNNSTIFGENKEVNKLYEKKKKKRKKNFDNANENVKGKGPNKETQKEQNKINDNQNKLGYNISYDKKNNIINDEDMSINSNSDSFFILTDNEYQKRNEKDNYNDNNKSILLDKENYDKNKISQKNDILNNEDNLNYFLYNKKFSNYHDDNFINSKINEMDIIDKQLISKTSFPPYECTNCNIFLKEITTRNYLNFSTLNEYINQSEHNLLLLKNKKIDQLEKVNKNIMNKMKQLKKENTLLTDKLKYFQTNFNKLDINLNKLIEENKILKSINEDLEKRVHVNEALSSNDEQKNKIIRKKKKERAKGKELFENSIDKDIFSDT
ncbi:conserved Plasmodium protein, unknown function [Plasmodium reichenowi]|uniref:Uncharacterized protein n=1 Tax=Plasmodium reichenowi TaxID=5854 RepID=A0A060RQ15_PLARE|nr:conserved Plasmodium protein, unknown function [Plasmodium reichenowi]